MRTVAFAAIVGFLCTALFSSWLASRAIALHNGLSHVDLGNALSGGPAFTLSGAGWAFFTVMFALIVYAATQLVMLIGRSIEAMVRWANKN